jgi:ABC-2 type transport system ATP-binding protein
MPEPVISVANLRKAYGRTVAVADVSLEVEEGEIYGIVGPNGSGKTTTVECLQGLRVADAGGISVLGLDPRHDRHALRQLVGSQLQESALPDRIKVREAVELFASLTPGRVDPQALIRQWGLADKENAFYTNLSGGQRQRLLVTLALVGSPRIVFLDEMTAGLDPAARREAWQLIKGVRDQGTTVVLITHFMDEAAYLCDRVAVFKHGKVIAVDTPPGLVARAAEGVTVRFSTQEPDLSFLRTVPGLQSVQREGARVEVIGSGPLLAHTAAALVAHGIAPADINAELPSLEDAYLRLTGEEE